jgi:hypothetical protein
MAIFCNTDFVLPIIDISLCSPTFRKAGVTQIAFTARGKGFSTVPTATDWNDRVNNTAALPTGQNPTNDDYPIRVLNVKASKPVTEYSETEISLGRTIRTPDKTFVEFESEDIPLSMYEAHRVYQDKKYNPITAWYFTEGLTYGGKNGVNATIQTDVVISDNDKEYIKIKGRITWKGGDPEMIETLAGLNFLEE